MSDEHNDDKVDAYAAVILIATITVGICYWLLSMPT